MDWSNERYVRLYTRDTPGWILLSWEAQALFVLLLRKVDRAGVLDLGRHGTRGLAASVRMPLDVVERVLPELLDDGCVELVGEQLVIPNFLEAQEAAKTDAQRQRESRERRRALARSQNVTERHVSGCDRHGRSRDVTLTRAVQSKADPEPPDPERGVRGERWRSEPDPRCAGPRPGSRPVSLAGRSHLGQGGEQLDDASGALDDEAPPANEIARDLALARAGVATDHEQLEAEVPAERGHGHADGHQGGEQLGDGLGAGDAPRRGRGRGQPAEGLEGDELARRAVGLLNELTGRSFRAGETVRGYARDLQRRGVEWEQLEAVIRAKHAEWSGDARMARQIKPSVLLRPKNCLRYLEEDVGTGAAPRPLAPRDAWELVEAEISRVGAYGRAALPSDVEAAAKRVGWRNLCMAREGEAERLFCSAYRSRARTS